MKIYIDNYNPTNIIKKLSKLEDYYKKQKQQSYIEINSPSGLFTIDDNKINKLKPIDKPIIRTCYNGIKLLLDNSFFEKELVLSQIPYEHYSTNITRFHYCVGLESNFYLIIECIYECSTINVNTITNANKSKDKYFNFIPTNFYFLTNEDIDNILIQKELNVFLSLLI